MDRILSDERSVRRLALIIGAGLAITIRVTLGYLLSTGTSDKAPNWMGALEENTAKQSFVLLGFLLLGLFPGDILTALAVGGYGSTEDLPWEQLLVFVG